MVHDTVCSVLYVGAWQRFFLQASYIETVCVLSLTVFITAEIIMTSYY
ncbi:hypothetical protein SPFL3102_00607 [Sporomusaceae bacterium FL31]|nr:hypothetical protein SPFL3101_01344 [Sporomusaceae bacterium FL31]GCE32810.1 hypothetical protein SPFL3102_00607 [Sporomusaceae bacterium]